MYSFSMFDKLSANTDKYDKFYKKLVEDNEKFNLTSITGFEETHEKSASRPVSVVCACRDLHTRVALCRYIPRR